MSMSTSAKWRLRLISLYKMRERERECVCVNMYVYICVYIVCMYVCVCILYVCMYVCMCVCVRIYISHNTHIHTNPQTGTHTNLQTGTHNTHQKCTLTFTTECCTQNSDLLPFFFPSSLVKTTSKDQTKSASIKTLSSRGRSPGDIGVQSLHRTWIDPYAPLKRFLAEAAGDVRRKKRDQMRGKKA